MTHRRRGVAAALSVAPLRWLGRNSYAWYLWHWPLIVVLPYVMRSPEVPAKVAAALVGLALADLSRRFVEEPVRLRSRFAASTRASWVLGLGLTGIVLLFIGATVMVGRHERRDPRLVALAAARLDFRLPTTSECGGSDPQEPSVRCFIGDPSGDRLVVLTGDSHAQQWIPPLDAVARDLHVRVLVRTRSGCPSVRLAVGSIESGRPAPKCQAYQQATVAMIRELEPKAVLSASAAGNYAAAGQATFDPIPRLCKVQVCPAEDDGTILYVDNNHLTAGAAQSFTPDLRAWLDAGLVGH